MTMKIDFLKNTNKDEDCILRLYDFNCSEADHLRRRIQKTIIEDQSQFSTTELDFIEHKNCSLTFHISDRDIGITSANIKEFQCDLTLKTYKKMIDLINPFTENFVEGHQWLYDLNTPIEFLISPKGTW